MSDAVNASARRTGGVPRRVARATGRALRPLWEDTLREPFRSGRLRIGTLPVAHRQAAALGLVTVSLLLLSLLAERRWRSTELVNLQLADRVLFVPLGLAAVTLVAVAIATTLVVWGALIASPWIRIGVAVAFGVLASTLLAPTTFDVDGTSWVLAHGRAVVHTSYGVVLGALVVSAVTGTAARHWAWSDTRVQRCLRVLAVLAVLTFFLTHLWMDVTFTSKGFPTTFQSLVGGAFEQIDGLRLPLVYASAVAVTTFSLDVSRSLAEGTRDLSRSALRVVVSLLVVVKLWFVLVRQWDFWTTYLTDRGPSVVRTVVSLVLLTALVRIVTRGSATTSPELARERLVYSTSLGLAAPFVANLAAICVGVWIYVVLSRESLPGFVGAFPGAELRDYGTPALAAAALVTGWLMLRGRIGGGTDLGAGLVVVGAWCLPSTVLTLFTLSWGFSAPLCDVLLTVAAAVLLVTRWRRLDTAALTGIGLVLVFVWLSLSDGDYVAYVGSVLGLPGVVVTVFGLALVVLNGSGFVSGSSPRMPTSARALMFVGYLVLSISIVNWDHVSHAPSSGSDADAAFYFLAVPIGAWMLGRELVVRRRAAPTPAG